MDLSEDFGGVFDGLREILRQYQHRLTLKKDVPGDYYLDSTVRRDNGREQFFGAVQTRKNHVSFHLMPVYMFPDLLENISPELSRRMQGKSCFNFKREEPDLLEELSRLTEAAFARMEAERLV
ncbi:hypothetical protein BH23GEM9_BH23GEM9_21970 [soil metagenome]